MFSAIDSVYLIAAFVLVFGLLTYVISWVSSNKLDTNKEQFLLANRNLGFFESSFSIAATWIWAPALFISAQKSYTNGWLGLFWFVVPNILCLILFSYFAVKIKKLFPTGFTLSEYMSKVYSDRVQSLYWLTLGGLAVCAFAVQLLAGGKLLASLMQITFFQATLLIAAIPLAYSVTFGLKSSVVTDYVKMIMILAIGAVLVPLAVSNTGGIDTVIAGFGGIKGDYLDIFSENSLMLMLTFGIPTTIGLLSGPFGDQSFWQRVFATREDKVKKSFFFAAFIFGIVPIMMGVLGFLAAGAGVETKDAQLINLSIVNQALGVTGVIALLMLIMAGLTSILDSKMCAVSSIVGKDIADRFGLEFLKSSRASMVILTVSALAIANIPDLKILHLFLFYGTLRSATLIPTVLTLLGNKLDEARVFYGILAAIFIGLPIFAYGNFNAMPTLIVAGSLLTVLIPYFSTRKYK